MSGVITVLDTKTFDKFISKDTVIVDFYADWCGPCKIMAPYFEKAASASKNVKFAKVNVDKDHEIAQRYGIMSIPTTIVFKKGEQVDMHTGVLNAEGILKLVKKYS